MAGALPNQRQGTEKTSTGWLTSVAPLRAAQKSGQAFIDVPSNVYFYLTVHPETR